MRRSRWEIYKDILNVTRRPKGVWKMMVTTETSYECLKECIYELIEKGMLEKIKVERKRRKGIGAKLLSTVPEKKIRFVYKTSEKGKVFSKKIEDMIKFWEK